MGKISLPLAGLFACLILIFTNSDEILATELAPMAYVPLELRHLFHPDEILDDAFHEGFIKHRSARAVSRGFEQEDEEYTFELASLSGYPCIMVQTEAIFYLEYHTLKYGVQTVRVDLPKDPEISGSCVRSGDTAVLTMRWDVFNFSLIFTENPEGNSYYLNTALLKYNQSSPIFYDATYKGNVRIFTRKGWNYFFTPLGKSYACQHGEDQGPLKMFNEDSEYVGNMTLWNSKFQPFVLRAKGEWGPENHCLPKATQIMREDVVPFVTAGIFCSVVAVLMLGYGFHRKFNVKKTDYTFYGEPGTEAHDITEGLGGGGKAVSAGETLLNDDEDQVETTLTAVNTTNGAGQPQRVVTQRAAAPPKPAAAPAQAAASNPFTTGKSSNPFNQ